MRQKQQLGLARYLTQRNLILTVGFLGLLAPFLLSDYVVDDVLIKAMIFGLLAISLDIAWGYAGILSFGHGALFGLGAYIMGIILVRWGSPMALPAAVTLGIIGPTVLAMIVGLLLFYTKTSELYIVVITLSLSLLFPQMVLRVPQWTGGMNGLSGIPLYPFSIKVKYYFIYIIIACVVYAVFRIVRSDFGRLLMAVRDNEQRIRFLGFSTSLIRLIAFTLSGAIAGVASVLYPPQNGFISQSLPGFVTSTMAIVWVAIGGRGTLIGPFLGAVFINWVSPFLNARFPHMWQLILGLIFIVVIIFIPGGIYSLILRFVKTRDLFTLTKKAARHAATESRHVSVNGLKVNYGTLEVLRGVDLKIYSGRLQCMIGPNGAGKSTLVNAMTGSIYPQTGQILLGETPIQRKPPQISTRFGLARTFQTANLFDTLSVGENLFLATCHGHLPSMLKRTISIRVPMSVLRILELSGLDQKLSIDGSGLGHGERKWLELLMVLCTEPNLVLLDEPTAGLTNVERKEVGVLLKDLVQNEGLGLLLIEHDIDFVTSIADQIAVLADGRILVNGPVDRVIHNEKVRELYLGENSA